MNAIDEFNELIMESDRGEGALYQNATPDQEIDFPVTREGFEACLRRACELKSLPVTNPLRGVFVGFIHHVENDTCATTLNKIAACLKKSAANQTSWKIDQEVKEVANKEMAAEREKLRKAAEDIEKEKKIAAALDKRSKKAAKKGGKSDKTPDEAAQAQAN